MLRRLYVRLYLQRSLVPSLERQGLLQTGVPTITVTPCRALKLDKQAKWKRLQREKETVKKLDFLEKYPGLVPYQGSFAVKRQPFSVNAPKYVSHFINELGQSLNVPYAYQDGHSAALCIEKICQLRGKNSRLVTDANEGLTREQWHELYIAIGYEIPHLDPRTLISLLSLYYKVQEFREDCFEKIYNQCNTVLSSKKTGSLRVKDLCSWSDILLQNGIPPSPKVDALVDKIWTLIGSKRLTAVDVLPTYQSLPKQYSHLYDHVFEYFRQHISRLTVYELFMIGMTVGQKTERTKEFKLMVGWIQKNLSNISTDDLKAILSTFTSKGYADSFLLNIFSEYIHLNFNKSTFDEKLVELMLEYSTMVKYYDPNILERACELYLKPESDYTYKELGILLKAIGILNYTPTQSTKFFGKVEEFLMREAMNIPPPCLLKMLIYLLYLDRPLFNLRTMIFSPTFQGLISELKDERPDEYRKCLTDLNLLYNGYKEIGFSIFPRLETADKDLYQRLSRDEYIEFPEYGRVVKALGDCIPVKFIGHFPRPSFEENYIELQFDENGELNQPIHPNLINMDIRYRKALILLKKTAYCSFGAKQFSNHLLGTENVNINVLKNQKVEVVVVNAFDIRYRKVNLNAVIKEFVEPDRTKLDEYFRWQRDLQEKTRESFSTTEEDALPDSKDSLTDEE